MSKKHYLVVLLMLIAGVAASLWLIPGQQEIAQMEVKSKLFAEAEAIYERELAKGDLSVGVVSQVTELYMQGGNIDKAIALMEKFVAEHPDNIEARQRLGQYYQYAQRSDDYRRNLEEINKLQPNPEQMKELEEIYQFTTEYDKQIEALRNLIMNPETREPKHYLELANLLAAKKDFAQAAATLQKLKKDYPQSFGDKEAQMLVTLLYDQKRNDEAFSEAQSWVEAHPSPESGATLIGIVHSKDSPQKASELLGYFTEAQIASNQALLEESILIDVAMGREDIAYERLKGLPETQWSPVVMEQLLLLAATHGDKELVKSLLPKINLTAMNEAQLARIAEAATIYGDTHLLAALVKAFPEEEYKDTYPLLTAMLAVAEKRDTVETAIARLDGLTLTPEQKLQVARVCARYGRPACAETFLSRLPEQKELTDSQIVAVGELHLLLKQWEEGHTYITEARKTRDSDAMQFIVAKYAAVAGNEAELAEWLVAKSDNTSTPMLRDVYFSAMNAGQYKSALLVAKTVHEKEKSATSRRDLAHTYIKLGQYANAAETLRPAPGETLTPADEDSYILALTKLSKDKHYRAELAGYASCRLKQNPPRKQKMALIYALINTKQYGPAMPYIRELALKEGGQWASLYAETLDKQGKHDEARKFWMQVAQQKSTSEKERMAIAYNLLERGYHQDAETLFKQQAERAGPDSQAVAALLYLWGPRLNASQMQWLGDHYASADARDKDKWATLIAQYASAETLPDVMREHPTLIKHNAVLEAYLQALADENQFAGSEKEFIENAKNSGETELLRTYAKVARANGYERESRRAYETLVMINPGDSAALREAGLIAFDQADYSASREYLSSYLQDKKAVEADKDVYRALYTYGELAKREHDDEKALQFYNLAYAEIDERQLTDADALSVKGQSLIAAGKGEQGLTVLREAMEQYPNNKTLKADYAASLIELKRYDEARARLDQDRPKALEPMIDDSLPAAGSDVAGVKLYSDDREAVITFTKPTDSGVSITEADAQKMAWVSWAAQGYNELRIVAKPGYRIATDSQGRLSAQPGTGVPARDVEQTKLRYELLTARLDLETGHVYDAVTRMDRLVAEHPKDAQVLGFAANAENYAGNWPEALQLLNDAHVLAEQNEDVMALSRDIRRLHGPEAKFDFEWVSRGPNDEYITTLSALMDVSRDWQLGGIFQHNAAHAENVRLADGRVGDFNGGRQQGELFLRYHAQPGFNLTLSAFANNESPGGGAVAQFINPLGQTAVTAEYRRPYWEYTQAVLDDAMRSRVGVIHTVKPTTKLTISGGPGVNRYDVDGQNNVMTTVSADFDVVYRLLDAQPMLLLGYSLDGEYTRSQKKGFDSTGAYTPLFPLRTREIHFVSLRGLYDFSRETYFEGMAGWGIDRFGGNGPAFEAKLTHELTESLDAQLRAYWGLDSSNTDNNLSRVGGYVRWRY